MAPRTESEASRSGPAHRDLDFTMRRRPESTVRQKRAVRGAMKSPCCGCMGSTRPTFLRCQGQIRPAASKIRRGDVGTARRVEPMQPHETLDDTPARAIPDQATRLHGQHDCTAHVQCGVLQTAIDDARRSSKNPESDGPESPRNPNPNGSDEPKASLAARCTPLRISRPCVGRSLIARQHQRPEEA